jgi:citrate synthase
MGMRFSTFAALSTLHPEANPSLQGPDIYSKSDVVTNKKISGTLVKVMTTAACAYSSRLGGPVNLSELADAAAYTENFLPMIDLLSEPTVPFSP